jgi:hypothetical protein
MPETKWDAAIRELECKLQPLVDAGISPEIKAKGDELHIGFTLPNGRSFGEYIDAETIDPHFGPEYYAGHLAERALRRARHEGVVL